MPPETSEVRRWLRKARHDWSAAQKIMTSDGVETEVAAFHCQQAVEKMLKAYLVYHAIDYEKVHDLGRLLDQCTTVRADFEALRDAVIPLTIYAVAFRYPGPAEPTGEQVEYALGVVDQVWAFLKQILPDDVLP